MSSALSSKFEVNSALLSRASVYVLQSLSDEELARAVVFMANGAGGNLKEPAPKK